MNDAKLNKEEEEEEEKEKEKEKEKEVWFGESSNELWPGQEFRLKVKKELFDGRSLFQEIKVFESSDYGNVLVLDNVIQVTERDEFAYQEMIAHLPLFVHHAPKRVLIVGGGDGGVLREVAKHSYLLEIVQCEIDEMVVNISKKYLPSLAKGYNDQDKRISLVIADGFQYLKSKENYFDVIITDSSDPIGPAQSLFEVEYYRLLNASLRDGGIVCSQCESIWLHLDLIANMVKKSRDIYPSVAYGYTTIPTYPSGQIGFLLCGKGRNYNFKQPVRSINESLVNPDDLRYYTPEIHQSAFVLPKFADKAINQ